MLSQWQPLQAAMTTTYITCTPFHAPETMYCQHDSFLSMQQAFFTLFRTTPAAPGIRLCTYLPRTPFNWYPSFSPPHLRFLFFPAPLFPLPTTHFLFKYLVSLVFPLTLGIKSYVRLGADWLFPPFFSLLDCFRNGFPLNFATSRLASVHLSAICFRLF